MRGSSKAAGQSSDWSSAFHRLKYAVHAPVDITLTTKEIAMRKARFTEHQIIAVIKSLKPDEPLKICREAGISGKPPTTSMDYLRFASTESGFELLLTSIRHQENLCPNG
jgi:hypothetical protein